MWPPKVVRIQVHLFKKDPGEITDAFVDISKDEVVIIDSVTICGLGFVDPSKFERAIVVSKFIPKIEKAIPVARKLYSDSTFEKVVKEYLKRTKCVKRGWHTLCVTPYGLTFEDALEMIEERVARRGLPEEIIMAHELASALGKWLQSSLKRGPSPRGTDGDSDRRLLL